VLNESIYNKYVQKCSAVLFEGAVQMKNFLESKDKTL